MSRLKPKFQSCLGVRGVRVLKLKSIYLGGGVARLFILIPNFLCVTMIINPNVLRIFQYFPLLFFGFLLLSIVFRCLLLSSVVFYHFPLSSVIFRNLPSYFVIIYRLLGTSICLYCILSYVSTLHIPTPRFCSHCSLDSFVFRNRRQHCRFE